jgi:hypothetical protein
LGCQNLHRWQSYLTINGGLRPRGMRFVVYIWRQISRKSRFPQTRAEHMPVMNVYMAHYSEDDAYLSLLPNRAPHAVQASFSISCSWDTLLSPSCLSGRNPRPGGTVGISCSSVNTLTLILKSPTNQLFMNAIAESENVPHSILGRILRFPDLSNKSAASCHHQLLDQPRSASKFEVFHQAWSNLLMKGHFSRRGLSRGVACA